MAAPFWQAGNFYLPGDLVQPVTAPAPNNPQVTNGGFAGATGWTFSGSAAYTASGGYGGGGCVQLPGNQPDGVALNNAQLVVPVGGTLTATAMIQQGASVAGATAGWAEVRWYSATNVELSIDKGNVVDSGSGGAWHQSKVDAVCPAGAAYARAAIHLTSVADHNHAIFGDNLSVSGASAGLPNGLVYRAVQPESGTSGANEPAWPGILGLQVVDNDVIWEAVTTSRITWTASPRYVSGATEPAWPTDIGSMVQDGTINWEAVSRRVEDERCPNSKVVAIVASKVFAVDKDIVKFCATANPLDWSTADDAGYLPTGLQQANSNDMAVLQQYRANLVALNASSFQNWQVDPDPAAMAILDQMEGIGSVWPKAAVPVSNDLFYLSQLGVRTVGIANAAENLSAGDVGAPIDPLVQASLLEMAADGQKVVATYYPGAGQYWLAFSETPQMPLGISGDIADAYTNTPVVGGYTAFGGQSPYFYEISEGSLPAGISIDSSTGQLSGIFLLKGNFSWEVKVTDATGETAAIQDEAYVCHLVWDYTTWKAAGPYVSNLGAGNVIWSQYWSRYVSCTGPGIKTSPDGVEWTQHGSDISLAVAENPNSHRMAFSILNRAYTSDDGGITLTDRGVANISGGNLHFVQGQFVARSNSEFLIGGPSGESWTAGSSFFLLLGATPTWVFIEHINKHLLIARDGSTGTAPTAVAEFVLGPTVPGLPNNSLVGATYSSRLKKAFLYTNGGLIIETADGQTYSTRYSRPGLSISNLIDIPELGALVAVGQGGGLTTVRSLDGGVTWQPFAGLNSYRSLAWSPELLRLVAIGQNVAHYADAGCEP